MRLIRLDDGLVDIFEAANGTEGWEKKKKMMVSEEAEEGSRFHGGE